MGFIFVDGDGLVNRSAEHRRAAQKLARCRAAKWEAMKRAMLAKRDRRAP